MNLFSYLQAIGLLSVLLCYKHTCFEYFTHRCKQIVLQKTFSYLSILT